MERLDAIVIGAGQGGGPLAGAFARAGRRVALIERAHVGGTCVNEGCTPTKTMVASARIAHLARRAREYGVEVGDTAVNLAVVRDRRRHIVSAFRAGSERALQQAGVELLTGSGSFEAAHRVRVQAPAGDRHLEAPLVIVNVGLRPSRPDIPGLDKVATLDSTSIMEIDTIPRHLIVLGGGYVGLEFAQMFARFGSAVTVVSRGQRLLPREDEDVSLGLHGVLEADAVRLILGAAATEVAASGDGVRVSVSMADGVAEWVHGSHLLVAVGRTPNTDSLGLEAAGVETDARGYIRVNERLETSAPGVYALGDVTGGPAFTHWSYDDFRILRANLIEGGSRTTAGRVLPYTLYTDPQLGRVGLTEAQAREQGRRVRIARLPMTSVARAIETDEREGFIKVVVDAEDGHILGAAVLGTEGGEIASMLQIAMLGNLPYTVLRDAIFAHPTFAESLNSVFTAMERGAA